MLEMTTIQQNPNFPYQPLVVEVQGGGFNDCIVTSLTIGTIGYNYLSIPPASSTTKYEIKIYSQVNYPIIEGTIFSICATSYPTFDFVQNEVLSCFGNDNNIQSNGSNQWLHFLYQGKLFASILDSENMGQINGSFYLHRSSDPIRSVQGVRILDRNFDISVSNQPQNPISVRFYFNNSDLNRLKSATSNGDPDNVTSEGDLMLTKVNTNNDCSIPQINGPGNAQYFQNGWATVPKTPYRYVEFEIPSFSSFALSGNNTVLPILLSEFKVEDNNNEILLSWIMQDAEDLDYFEVQKTYDVEHFTSLIQIPFEIGINEYEIIDTSRMRLETTVYYRLKMISIDGLEIYSKIEAIKRNFVHNGITLFPNPARNSFSIQGLRNKDYDMHIYNLQGILVNTQKYRKEKNVDVSMLRSGIYLLEIQGDNRREIIKLVKS